MLKEKIYIEDLILCLAGLAHIDESKEYPKLMTGDHQLIDSLGKQLIRNLGFTDKQNELAKRKVEDYRGYFSFIPNLEEVRNRNRISIREIDRSRWIKIVENDKGTFQISVRFTFQKKLISSLDEIRRNIKDKGTYDKQSKTHFFEYTERNLFEIVEAFKGKHFDLDDTVQEIYEKLSNLKLEEHIPGVYDYKILNLHPSGVKMLTDELGEPDEDNILLFKDRSLKYGLSHIDNLPNTESIVFKIANRNHPNVVINSDTIKLDTLLLSLEDLQRYPILILVPVDQCFDVISEFQKYIKNLIADDQVSVMFRLDNQGEGIAFNEYVRQHRLNNKVDSNTKIVYCLDNKIPKPLLNSSWRPNTVLLHGARPTGGRRVVECYSDVDLIIHYHDGQLPVHYYYRQELEVIK